jgi:hypothetical protein
MPSSATTTPTRRVAKIVAIDSDGNVELEVLPGTVESHLDPLARV